LILPWFKPGNSSPAADRQALHHHVQARMASRLRARKKGDFSLKTTSPAHTQIVQTCEIDNTCHCRSLPYVESKFANRAIPFANMPSLQSGPAVTTLLGTWRTDIGCPRLRAKKMYAVTRREMSRRARRDRNAKGENAKGKRECKRGNVKGDAAQIAANHRGCQSPRPAACGIRRLGAR
jgi:hypothetical protein